MLHSPLIVVAMMMQDNIYAKYSKTGLVRISCVLCQYISLKQRIERLQLHSYYTPGAYDESDEVSVGR